MVAYVTFGAVEGSNHRMRNVLGCPITTNNAMRKQVFVLAKQLESNLLRMLEKLAAAAAAATAATSSALKRSPARSCTSATRSSTKAAAKRHEHCQ